MSITAVLQQADIVKFCIFSYLSSRDLAVCILVCRAWKKYSIEYLNLQCWVGIENILKTFTLDEIKLNVRNALEITIMSPTNIRELQQKGGKVILFLSSRNERKREDSSSEILAEKIWSMIALEFAKLGYKKKAYEIVNVRSLFQPPMVRLIEGEFSKLKIKGYKNRDRGDLKRTVLSVKEGFGPLKMQRDWRGSKIDFEGDIQQAYCYRQYNKNPFGFISDLSFPMTGHELHSNLHIQSLIGKRQVIGIISQFLAVPSVDSCILTAQITKQNIGIMLNALRVGLVKKNVTEIEQYLLANRVPVVFGVFTFDWDIKNEEYYQSIDLYGEKGFLTSIEIENQSSKEITQQLNHRCTFQISRTRWDEQ